MSLLAPDVVQSGTLDHILAFESNYAMSEALDEFYSENDIITLRAAVAPLEFKFRNRAYHVEPGQELVCSPRLGCELLLLHGKGGHYYQLDSVNGVRKHKMELMSPSMREFYKGVEFTFQEGFLYHDDRPEDVVAEHEEELDGGSKTGGLVGN